MERRERRIDYDDYTQASNPSLYFPIEFALNWWPVAPIRLPTSIRYLDTPSFARRLSAIWIE